MESEASLKAGIFQTEGSLIAGQSGLFPSRMILHFKGLMFLSIFLDLVWSRMCCLIEWVISRIAEI